MLRRSLAFVSSILVTVSVLGCSGGSFSFAYHEAPVRRVRVHTEHVCTHDCHHFYNGTRLVVIDGHRHGHGCGHHWDGGHWVVALTAGGHGHSAHICTRDCHQHYYNGTRLVVLNGHHHGHGCGHHWDGGHWVVSLAAGGHGHSAHICTRDCHRHYYDGTRLVVLNGHHHGPGCGHRWSGKFWVSVKLGHGAIKKVHTRPTPKKARARVRSGKVRTKKATTKAVQPRKAKSKTSNKTRKLKSSKSKTTKPKSAKKSKSVKSKTTKTKKSKSKRSKRKP